MTSTRHAYIKSSEVLAAADVYRGPRRESVPPSLIVGKCGREDRRRLARLGFDRFSPDTTLASDCWIFQTIYEIIIKTETHKKIFVWEPQTFLRIFHWACKKCWKFGSWCFLRTLNMCDKRKERKTNKKQQVQNVASLKLLSDVHTVCGSSANHMEICPMVVKSFPSGSSQVGRIRPLGIMNLDLTIKIFQLGQKHWMTDHPQKERRRGGGWDVVETRNSSDKGK